MSTRWHMPRRTFLRGAGVSVALPLLDAMMPVSRALANPSASPDAPAAASDAPVRYAALFMPNGVDPRAWTPEGRGREFKLSPILEPLAAHKDELLVLSHLEHDRVKWGDGHYTKSAAFLTGTAITKTTGADVRSNGVSVDQLIARHVGHLTRLPSLELSLEPHRTAVDVQVGFTQMYGGFISWSTPTTPVARELNPKLAFDRLFRSQAGKVSLGPADRSVLDLVLDDAAALRGRLGADDRRKLDEYLESVRSVEHRIDFEQRRREEHRADDPKLREAVDALGKRVDAFHAGSNDDDDRRSIDHTEHARLMLDVVFLAFWSDSTRVASLMFGRDVSPRNFSFLEGVSGGHHQISHHENDPKKMDEYRRINVWHVQQYAYLLDRMKQVREGERTLLDNSTIMFGSSLRDGNAHAPSDLPIVLAGRAGGRLAPGRHVMYRKSTPLSNLYLANLQHAGVPAKSFSDAEAPLPGLDDPNGAGD